MLVLGAGVATFAIAPAYRYGAWQDPSAVVMAGGLVLNYGAGLQTALLHVAKLAFVASFVPAWRRSKWAGLMCASICVPLVLLSVWNAVALLALQRSTRVTDERAASERALMVRSELKSVGERLALIGWKPRETVEADIAAERLRWMWDATSGCTNVSSGGHRQFCAQVARMEGERVAAIGAEHLRARETELRRDVASHPVGAESRHPDLIMLAEWLGISLDTAEVSRTLWWAGVVELAAVGFAGFFWATTREDKSEVCIATLAPPERELTLAASMASTAPPPSRRVRPEAAAR